MDYCMLGSNILYVYIHICKMFYMVRLSRELN